MLELILLCLAPAAGGAALHKLWTTRPARQRHSGTAVGQIPQQIRRRTRMAVRRAGSTFNRTKGGQGEYGGKTWVVRVVDKFKASPRTEHPYVQRAEGEKA